MFPISFKQFSTNSFFEIIPLESKDAHEDEEGNLSRETWNSSAAELLRGAMSSRLKLGEHEREIDPGGVSAISGRRYPMLSWERDPLGCGSPINVIPFGMGTIEYPMTGTPAGT